MPPLCPCYTFSLSQRLNHFRFIFGKLHLHTYDSAQACTSSSVVLIIRIWLTFATRWYRYSGARAPGQGAGCGRPRMRRSLKRNTSLPSLGMRVRSVWFVSRDHRTHAHTHTSYVYVNAKTVTPFSTLNGFKIDPSRSNSGKRCNLFCAAIYARREDIFLHPFPL